MIEVVQAFDRTPICIARSSLASAQAQTDDSGRSALDAAQTPVWLNRVFASVH
jgi:hypothetical protein